MYLLHPWDYLNFLFLFLKVAFKKKKKFLSKLFDLGRVFLSATLNPSWNKVGGVINFFF